MINIEALENLLDYAFIKLGVPGRSDGIGMPVVMTEAICNPGYTRGRESLYRHPTITEMKLTDVVDRRL